MRDPEHEPVRWDEPIIASSPEEAMRECKRLAEKYKVELELVQQPIRLKGKAQLYRCIFVGTE